MGYAQLADGIRDLASSSPMGSEIRLVFQIRKYFEVSAFVLVSLGHSFTEKYDKFTNYVKLYYSIYLWNLEPINTISECRGIELSQTPRNVFARALRGPITRLTPCVSLWVLRVAFTSVFLWCEDCYERYLANFSLLHAKYGDQASIIPPSRLRGSLSVNLRDAPA